MTVHTRGKKKKKAYLLLCCHAGGVSWSASSHRGCMSEDMLLETGFGDEKAPRLHGRKWGGGGGSVFVCVTERESERGRERKKGGGRKGYKK